MSIERIVARVLVSCSVCMFGFARLAGATAATLHPVTTSTSVMSRPTEKSDVVAAITPETLLEVIGTEQGWFWVLLPRDVNGTSHAGWIRASDVELLAGELPLNALEPGAVGTKTRQNDRTLRRARQKLEKAKRNYSKLAAEQQGAAEAPTASDNQPEKF